MRLQVFFPCSFALCCCSSIIAVVVVIAAAAAPAAVSHFVPFFVPNMLSFIRLRPLFPQLVIDSRICMLTETESCNSVGYVMRLSSRLQTQLYIPYTYIWDTGAPGCMANEHTLTRAEQTLSLSLPSLSLGFVNKSRENGGHCHTFCLKGIWFGLRSSTQPAPVSSVRPSICQLVLVKIHGRHRRRRSCFSCTTAIILFNPLTWQPNLGSPSGSESPPRCLDLSYTVGSPQLLDV